MDILLDNPLATMYGPYFLIFYGFLIFFTLIILGVVKSQIDKTNNLLLPPIPSQIDPYEIAYLRGGTNEVARSVVFALMQRGLIEIANDGAKNVIKKANPQAGGVRNLNQIEQLALNWLGNSRDPKEVFESNGLVKQLESYGQMYQTRLEQGQMLTGDDDRVALKLVRWAAYLVIFGLGAYKLLASIAHGYYNVIFLVIFCIVGLLIARAIAKLPRVTKLGKAYLERLQLAFNNLKFEAQKPYLPSNKPRGAVVPQTSFAGVDPLLLSVGVFGSAILAGTVFDSYNQTFQKAQQQQQAAASSSCGSGCGSSCSSSSSGDSGGSSCSSGSSCGGGCGGGGCS
jgi:uncharacterized protein (TIGR04222 family)